MQRWVEVLQRTGWGRVSQRAGSRAGAESWEGFGVGLGGVKEMRERWAEGGGKEERVEGRRTGGVGRGVAMVTREGCFAWGAGGDGREKERMGRGGWGGRDRERLSEGSWQWGEVRKWVGEIWMAWQWWVGVGDVGMTREAR